MKTIWKWTLDIVPRQTINVPRNAHLLTVQMQGQHPQLWAVCDSGAITEPREIAIYGTGNSIPFEPSYYIATFQMNGGAFVWHVFEVGNV